MFLNVFGWGWQIVDKWNKKRNQLLREGEQELQVGNYSEAEKFLTLAAAEAESHAASTARRAMILRILTEAKRKQGNLAGAEQTIRQAIALLSNTAGQSRGQYAECLEAQFSDTHTAAQRLRLWFPKIQVEGYLAHRDEQAISFHPIPT